MKKQIALFSLFILTSIPSIAQEIPDAPTDKAVVYFARTSSLGFAINFVYFDSLQAIGRFNGPKYMRYECEPGKHLFWARSENKDFVEADLEAGKIYFIEVEVKMGAIKAGVELSPVDPKDTKTMDKILKLVAKKPSETFTKEELETETKNFDDVVVRGFSKYNEDKQKGKAIKILSKTMFYTK
jgi:hypothetical protein